MAKKTSEPLFSVDYSQDELAVVASLLQVDALPGAAPSASADESMRAAAARSLVARRALEFTDDGGVEIAQPHATLLSLSLVANTVVALERRIGDEISWHAWYLSDGGVVQQNPVTGAILRYTLIDGFDAARVRAVTTLDAGPSENGTPAVSLTERAVEAIFEGPPPGPVELPGPLADAWNDDGRVERLRLIQRDGPAVTIDELMWLDGGAHGVWKFARDVIAVNAQSETGSAIAAEIDELLGPVSVAPGAAKQRHS